MPAVAPDAVVTSRFTRLLDGCVDPLSGAGGPLTALRTNTSPPAGPGHRAPHEEQAALGVAFDDLEVERRDAAVAVLAGHAHALEHTGGCGARADRAGGAVLLVVAVAGALALEVVALHHAGEALALADAGDVDALAGAEHVGRDDLADLVAREVVDPELREVPGRLGRRPA